MFKSRSTPYIFGFVLSVILTLASYFAVTQHFFSSGGLVLAILALAIAQLLVQLIFFLHLGQESGPRWNLIAFLSAAGMIFIVVVGSLWIMNHLNYNMTPSEMNSYIFKDEGLSK